VNVGKNSYFGYGKPAYNVTLGRFCAFADNVPIGAVGHPTQWLSINQFFHRDLYGSNPNGKHIDDTMIGNGVFVRRKG